MKKLIASLLMCSALCAAGQWQTCGIVTNSGDLVCGTPQSRQSAEMQALIYNTISQGAFIAWARPVPKGKHKTKPQPGSPVITPEKLPAQPSTY